MGMVEESGQERMWIGLTRRNRVSCLLSRCSAMPGTDSMALPGFLGVGGWFRAEWVRSYAVSGSDLRIICAFYAMPVIDLGSYARAMRCPLLT
eukprot:695785-Rhodomonas_salina.2